MINTNVLSLIIKFLVNRYNGTYPGTRITCKGNESNLDTGHYEASSITVIICKESIDDDLLQDSQ